MNTDTTNAAVPEMGTVLTRRDAKFHDPFFAEPMWAETNWFCFVIPEAQMMGHVRALFRTNQKVVSSQIIVYSGFCATSIDALYLQERVHMPMPPMNLNDYRLDNGLAVKMTEPLMAWDVRYDGIHDTYFDLHCEGITPPLETSEIRVAGSREGYTIFHRTEPGSLKIGHIDQTMHVTGQVRVLGQDYEVDFCGNRDHSWSPRREWGHRIIGNFDEGHFGRGDLSFHVQTRSDEDSIERAEVTNGYLIEDRVPYRLTAGEGRFTLDRWYTDAAEYELVDERGKTFRFFGEPVSRIQLTDVNSYTVMQLMRWECDGEFGFGEVKWHWDLQEMQVRRQAGLI